MPNQNVAVVTGATTGLGRFVALGLARAGLHTVLVARNAGRGQAAQRFIAEHVPHASTEVVLADLSSSTQTRQAGEAVAARHPRIAVLVNAAGLLTPRRQVTVEGNERMLAVNHLAPFVLTSALEPALRAGAPSRVIGIGSITGRANLLLDDLQALHSFGPLRTYRQTKLAMALVSVERARRLSGHGVAVNVVYPGLMATTFGSVPGPLGWCWRALRPFMKSPERGSDAPLFAALSSTLADVTGMYFHQREPALLNPPSANAKMLQRLWSETERLVDR